MAYREKIKYLSEIGEKKKECKTFESYNNSNNSLSYESDDSSNDIIELRKKFFCFANYKSDIKNKYFNEFKKSYQENIKDKHTYSEIQNDFEKKFPYISGMKKIDIDSINIHTKQYFMNEIFNKIFELFEDNKAYPIDEKYGLVHFLEQEWIFFTLEEYYYQLYLLNQNRIMFFMYNDYLNNTLYTNSFFTDEDKYILPSNIRAKIIEKNSFNYFQLKTKLKSAPDLLIKLKDKNTYFETNNQDKLLTFNEYINQIQLNFDYLEIDGALINDSEEIIYLRHEEIDKPILAYKEINFKNNICELGTKDNKNKVLKIPANSVVFFQTIIKGPIMKLNGNDFDKTMLHLNEMKDELAAILYKMIIYNKYFYELYIKLGLINEKCTLLFF